MGVYPGKHRWKKRNIRPATVQAVACAPYPIQRVIVVSRGGTRHFRRFGT